MKLMHNKIMACIDLYKNLALPVKASIWYLFCSILQKAIGFLTTPIFTRVMSTDDFGVVSMYYSWEAIFTVFGTLYLYNGVYNNAMIKYKQDRNGFTSSMQTLTTFLSLGVYCIYFVFCKQLYSIMGLSNAIMALMMVDIVFTAGMSFWSIRNRYEYKYKSVAIFTVLDIILMPTVSLILVMNADSHKVEARILGTVIVHIMIYGIVYILNLVRGRKTVEINYWKYAVKFNLPLIPHYLSSTIMIQSDRVMINSICGTVYAGIYSIATNVTSIMSIVTVSINQAITPWIYEMLEKNQMKEIGRITYRIISLVGIGFILTSYIAPEIIGVLAPEEYRRAIWVTPPLLVGTFLYFVYCYFGNIEIYFHKQKSMLFSSVIVAIINVSLDYVMIMKFGFIAASYATLIAYYIYALLHYLFMSQVCKEKGVTNPYNFFIVFGISLVISLMIMTPMLLYNTMIIRYAVFVVLCFICLMFFIKNREMIKKLVSKKDMF